MAQLGFYFDQTRCMGCRTCQVACKVENELGVGDFYRRVTVSEGGTMQNVWAAALSMACNHCERPACVANCPVGALAKDEETGLVFHDKEVCVSCGTCASACPYSAPTILADGSVGKCEGCYELVLGGEVPPCVSTCAMRCLEFGDLDELKKLHGNQQFVQELAGMPSAEETGPSMLIVAKSEAME